MTNILPNWQYRLQKTQNFTQIIFWDLDRCIGRHLKRHYYEAAWIALAFGCKANTERYHQRNNLDDRTVMHALKKSSTLQ